MKVYIVTQENGEDPIAYKTLDSAWKAIRNITKNWKGDIEHYGRRILLGRNGYIEIVETELKD